MELLRYIPLRVHELSRAVVPVVTLFLTEPRFAVLVDPFTPSAGVAAAPAVAILHPHAILSSNTPGNEYVIAITSGLPACQFCILNDEFCV